MYSQQILESDIEVTLDLIPQGCTKAAHWTTEDTGQGVPEHEKWVEGKSQGLWPWLSQGRQEEGQSRMFYEGKAAWPRTTKGECIRLLNSQMWVNLTHPSKTALEEAEWEVTSWPLLLLNTTYSLSRKTNNIITASPLSEPNQRARGQVLLPPQPLVPHQLFRERITVKAVAWASSSKDSAVTADKVYTSDTFLLSQFQEHL